MKALTVCATPGCGELTVKGYCPDCEGERARERYRRRKGGEGMPQHWRAIRARYLKKHPLCECEECGRLPEDSRPVASDVHHAVGREEGGSSADSNLEALTHGHHSRRTVRQQPGGFSAFRERDTVRSRIPA